jgi:hypothetical protein
MVCKCDASSSLQTARHELMIALSDDGAGQNERHPVQAHRKVTRANHVTHYCFGRTKNTPIECKKEHPA